VLLQRQPRAGVHADALDLIARPGVGALVEAPRAVNAPVLQRLGPLSGLDLLDQVLDPLRMLLRHHQHRVRGRDDDDIFEADHGGEHGRLGTDQAVAVLITSAGPSITLPEVSCGWASQTAFQLPMSDQRKPTGNTAASAVRFITA
jgi:hypothetical protein